MDSRNRKQQTNTSIHTNRKPNIPHPTKHIQRRPKKQQHKPRKPRIHIHNTNTTPRRKTTHNKTTRQKQKHNNTNNIQTTKNNKRINTIQHQRINHKRMDSRNRKQQTIISLSEN